MNLYEISQIILGELPSEWTILYGMFTFILGILAVIIVLAPIVLVFKVVGGK